MRPKEGVWPLTAGVLRRKHNREAIKRLLVHYEILQVRSKSPSYLILATHIQPKKWSGFLPSMGTSVGVEPRKQPG